MTNFYDHMERFGRAVAFILEGGETSSYEAIVADAESFGAHIVGRQLVFVLADNCLESVVGYIGCLRSRAPVALLARQLHPELLQNLLLVYRPHYVWLPRDRASHVPGAKEVFALGNYVLLNSGAEALLVHDDLALLMTTSGSTGSPKLVRQSYENIAANARSIAQFLGIRIGDRAITTLPMQYVYGLSVINSHLQVGAATILTNASLMEKRFWEVLKVQQATAFAGVPYTYELLKRLRFERMNLPSLKVLTQAGGKLDAARVHELAAWCREKGKRFYVMYGAAEATARMAYLPPDSCLDNPSTIGIAIPGGELWLQDDNGQIITQSGLIGELFYRGPNVSLGYASCRGDLALGDERRGVLPTGDLAMRDEHGFYHIVGRKSRFLKLFGNRVNLEELEQLLRKEGVECACAGEDDRLSVYITDSSCKDTISSTVEKLTRLHHSAFRMIVVDSIPRNEAGKIIYANLS